MYPPRPTNHATIADGEEPARISPCTGTRSAAHVLPPSLERTIALPATRHWTAAPGEITWIACCPLRWVDSVSTLASGACKRADVSPGAFPATPAAGAATGPAFGSAGLAGAGCGRVCFGR